VIFKNLAALANKLSPGLRQVLSNTSWLFADKFLQMGLGLLVGVWVARYLGPDQYGLWSYALSYAGLFSPLSNLGLDGVVVRDLARDPSGKDETLGTAFVLKLCGAIIALLLAVGTISLMGHNDVLTRSLVAIAACGGIFGAFATIGLWFRSLLQSKYTVVANRVVYVFISAVKIVLIQIRAPLIAFAGAMSAEDALSGVALVIAYRVKGQAIQAWRASFQRAKNLLSESWPLLLAGFTNYIYSKIDQVMLGSLMDAKSELAFYSTAVKLSEIFDFIPMLLNASLLPKLAEIKQKNPENYTKIFQIYFDIMLIFWLAVAIPVSLGAPLIVKLLYGESYAPSAPILSIYVWAQFGSNFGVARSTFMLIEGKQKWSLFISALGAAINVCLNLYFIPRLGALGATIDTLVTYLIVTVLLNFIIADLRSVGVWIIRAFNLPKAVLRLSGLLR
jgi:O-antigen/teichoic acid export membrane protein